MTDVFDKEKRSAVMRNIKSCGNRTTELAFIKVLKEYGIKGWRRGYPVKGHPDFVFLNRRVAVFVDGCFWHGHDCKTTLPKENEEFWIRKIKHNIEYDKAITKLFERRGWIVIRIWECELKKKNRSILVEKIKVLID